VRRKLTPSGTRDLEESSENKSEKSRRAVVWVGILLLGAVSLFLPFFKGVLFLVVGLLILSSEYVWAHHLLEKIRIRFPGSFIPPRPGDGAQMDTQPVPPPSPGISRRTTKSNLSVPLHLNTSGNALALAKHVNAH
jgi:hypothetical protein